jgi:hypothetical protein
MKKHSGVKIGIIAAAAMMLAGQTAAPVTPLSSSEITFRNIQAAPPSVAYQYTNPFNFRKGGGRSGRRKMRGGSFMGPGIRKKKTNKIHRSRMLKRKHARK